MTLRPLGPSVTLTARASFCDAAAHRVAGFLIEGNHFGHGMGSLCVGVVECVRYCESSSWLEFGG